MYICDTTNDCDLQCCILLHIEKIELMKLKLSTFLLVIVLVAYAIWQQPDQKDLPKPTDTILHEGEDGENQLKREAWFELMHQAEEGINWRQIEYQNFCRRFFI